MKTQESQSGTRFPYVLEKFSGLVQVHLTQQDGTFSSRMLLHLEFNSCEGRL